MVHGGGGARRWWRRGARTQRPEGPSLPGLADRHTCPIAALRHTTWLGLITMRILLPRTLPRRSVVVVVCPEYSAFTTLHLHYRRPPGQRPWWRMVHLGTYKAGSTRRGNSRPGPLVDLPVLARGWAPPGRSPTDLISYPSVQYLARRDIPPLPVAPNNRGAHRPPNPPSQKEN